MAGRSEARIFASIWNDPTFRALTRRQQGMYLFLLSQPDLSFCGVISLRPRRWAQKAKDLTPDQVWEDLKALASPFPEGPPEGIPEGTGKPFIVLDEIEEEVFVRSLIRNDGIWKQPNLLKAAREAAKQVTSPRIRAAMLDELKRIPMHESSSALAKEVMANFIQDLEKTLGKPSGNPPGKGTADPRIDQRGEKERSSAAATPPSLPSSSEKATASGRASSQAGDANFDTTGDELPGMPPAPPKPPAPGSDDDPAWREFWEVYPRKVDKKKASQAWARAVKETAPFVIIAGAKRYRDQVNREGREKRFIKHPTTWLNGKCWNDDYTPDEQPAQPRQQGNYNHRPWAGGPRSDVNAVDWSQGFKIGGTRR